MLALGHTALWFRTGLPALGFFKTSDTEIGSVYSFPHGETEAQTDELEVWSPSSRCEPELSQGSL